MATLGERVRRRLQAEASAAIYATIGRWLIQARAPWMIEHRPDFLNRPFPDYRKLSASWIKGNQANNGGDYARFYALCQNVSLVLSEQVEGDLVELGVYRGNSAALLAHFARANGRRLYLFDTFEGFDQRDFKGEDSRQSPTHFAKTSLERVKAAVGDQNVVYVKGYFPDSLAGMEAPEKIAIAHLDCDLYEPMRAGLEAFFPRVSPGGMLLLHDYGSGEWPGATRAVNEFFADKVERPIILPDKSGTAVVRKALLAAPARPSFAPSSAKAEAPVG